MLELDQKTKEAVKAAAQNLDAWGDGCRLYLWRNGAIAIRERGGDRLLVYEGFGGFPIGRPRIAGALAVKLLAGLNVKNNLIIDPRGNFLSVGDNCCALSAAK